MNDIDALRAELDAVKKERDSFKYGFEQACTGDLPELAKERDASIARVKDLEKDKARLDWLLFNITGGELRRMGITPGAWSQENFRAAIDAVLERTKDKL